MWGPNIRSCALSGGNGPDAGRLCLALSTVSSPRLPVSRHAPSDLLRRVLATLRVRRHAITTAQRHQNNPHRSGSNLRRIAPVGGRSIFATQLGHRSLPAMSDTELSTTIDSAAFSLVRDTTEFPAPTGPNPLSDLRSGGSCRRPCCHRGGRSGVRAGSAASEAHRRKPYREWMRDW